MVEAPRLRTWYRTFKHMKVESKIHMPDLPNSICNEYKHEQNQPKSLKHVSIKIKNWSQQNSKGFIKK